MGNDEIGGISQWGQGDRRHLCTSVLRSWHNIIEENHYRDQRSLSLPAGNSHTCAAARPTTAADPGGRQRERRNHTDTICWRN